MRGPKYNEKFVQSCAKKARAIRLLAQRKYSFLRVYLDDLEAWSMLRLIEGRSLKTKNNYMCVDYMRATFGDARADSHLGPKQFISMNLMQEDEHKQFAAHEPKDFESVLSDKILANDILESLPLIVNKQEVKVIRKYFREAKTYREIGKEMGFTESRAAQIMQAGLAKLRLFYFKYLTDF